MDSIFDPQHQHLRQDSKIVAALERVNQAFRVLLWEKAQQHGLSPIQIQIMVYLRSHDQSQCRVGHLARELGVTAATVSDAVTTLEEKHFIIRLMSPDDRRAADLKLTAIGKRLVKKLSSWADPLRNAVATLPQSDQQTTLIFLMKLIESLQQEGIVTVARMCITCKHFGENAHANSHSPHHCNQLDKPLATADLRIDCGEYESRH